MTHQKNKIPPQNHHKLSVQLTLSGLSFLVTSNTTNKTVVFLEKKFDQTVSPEELLLELQSELNNNVIFDSLFSQIIHLILFCYPNNKVVLRC